jgi:hypothetical protein
MDIQKTPSSKFVFIPNRLELDFLPSLRVLPYNVFIVRWGGNGKGVEGTCTVFYHPDIRTLEESESDIVMDYLNYCCGDYKFRIKYNKIFGIYSAEKYRKEELIGSATGADWDSFFINVGRVGLAEG